jgi:hypothetical protein
LDLDARTRLVSHPHLPQALEQLSRRRFAKMLEAVTAAKSSEVEAAALLITNKPLGMPISYASCLRSETCATHPWNECEKDGEPGIRGYILASPGKQNGNPGL